jgi:hypothetical protein
MARDNGDGSKVPSLSDAEGLAKFLDQAEESIRELLEHLLPSLRVFGNGERLGPVLHRRRLLGPPKTKDGEEKIDAAQRSPTTLGQLLMLMRELDAKGVGSEHLEEAATAIGLHLRGGEAKDKKDKQDDNAVHWSTDQLAMSVLMTNDELRMITSSAKDGSGAWEKAFTTWRNAREAGRESGSLAAKDSQWFVELRESATDRDAKDAKWFNPWGAVFPALHAWLSYKDVKVARALGPRIIGGLLAFVRYASQATTKRTTITAFAPEVGWTSKCVTWDGTRLPCHSALETHLRETSQMQKSNQVAQRAVFARNAMYAASAVHGAMALATLLKAYGTGSSGAVAGGGGGAGKTTPTPLSTLSITIIPALTEMESQLRQLCNAAVGAFEELSEDDRSPMMFWLVARRLIEARGQQWRSLKPDDLQTISGLDIGEHVPPIEYQTSAVALARWESHDLTPSRREAELALVALNVAKERFAKLTRGECGSRAVKDTYHRAGLRAGQNLESTDLAELPGHLVRTPLEKPNPDPKKLSTFEDQTNSAGAWDNIIYARMGLMAWRLLRVVRRFDAFAQHQTTTRFKKPDLVDQIRGQTQPGSPGDGKDPEHALKGELKTAWTGRFGDADPHTGLSSLLFDTFLQGPLLDRHRGRLAPKLKEGQGSFILYGPPGSGKTYTVETMAEALGWPLISLSPADFLKSGVEMLEARASEIFRRLEHLDQCVVFFDECDELFRTRHDVIGGHRNMLSFATASMLPKLQNLSKKRRVIFVLATNYLHHIDDAIRREGRFDARLFVDRPHTASRATIIYADIFKSLKVDLRPAGGPLSAEQHAKIMWVQGLALLLLRATHGLSHPQLRTFLKPIIEALDAVPKNLRTDVFGHFLGLGGVLVEPILPKEAKTAAEDSLNQALAALRAAKEAGSGLSSDEAHRILESLADNDPEAFSFPLDLDAPASTEVGTLRDALKGLMSGCQLTRPVPHESRVVVGVWKALTEINVGRANELIAPASPDNDGKRGKFFADAISAADTKDGDKPSEVVKRFRTLRDTVDFRPLISEKPPHPSTVDYLDWIIERSEAEFEAAQMTPERRETLAADWATLPGFAEALTRKLRSSGRGGAGGGADRHR